MRIFHWLSDFETAQPTKRVETIGPVGSQTEVLYSDTNSVHTNGSDKDDVKSGHQGIARLGHVDSTI